ncbi:MAG: nuclear transport factor 2 family protein [Caulobacteraceae bacterium]
MTIRTFSAALGALMALTAGAALARSSDEARAVAALDTAYQAAVERNDAEAMGKILRPDMILVTADGAVHSGADLMRIARAGEVGFEHQVEDPGTQTVRLFGPDTAVVTARLWLKGVQGGQAFDRRLWFSDTYVRTARGWRYAFGQASSDLAAIRAAAASR